MLFGSMVNFSCLLGELQYATPVQQDMQEIIPGLFLGPHSCASEDRRNELLERGIKYIVCVRQLDREPHIQPHFAEDALFKYLILDIEDGEYETIITYFGRVKQFVDEAWSRSSKVLVHGNKGNSRSASLVLAFVMQKMSLNFEKAFLLVKERRDCIQPNRGFVAQLFEYELLYKTMKSSQTSGESSSSYSRSKRKLGCVDVDLDKKDGYVTSPPNPAFANEMTVALCCAYEQCW